MSTAFRTRNAFLSLPNEMIDRILCNLDFWSLLKCKEVCTKLKAHVETAKETQYIIELAIAGLKHNSKNTWSSARRLESLRKYQSGWESLDWSTEKVVPMLRGGMWELYGGVLAQTDEEGTFHFHKLPSESRRIEEESWTLRPNIEGQVRDFGIDPSQDLLVWITTPTATSPFVSLHLRTLKTAEKHPLACQPTIRYDTGSHTGRWFPSIKITQDFIGLQVLHRLPLDEEGGGDFIELLVWNWKENKLELAVQTDDTQSFTFVSDKHLVLANQYISEDLEKTEGYLVLIDFRAEDEMKKKLSEVRNSIKLRYPDMANGTRLTSFSISSEPGPGWATGKDDTSPFFVARDDRIFTVSMRFVQDHEYAFDHFISLSAFEKCLGRLDTSLDQELKWSEWAPTETRMIRTSLPAPGVWVCFAYGSRSIGRELHRKKTGVVFSAVVYDFNQLACRRDAVMNKKPAPPVNYTRVDSSSVIRHETIWTETIETSLPYRRCSRALPIRPGGHSLMCTSDNIILVDATERAIRIYTF